MLARTIAPIVFALGMAAASAAPPSVPPGEWVRITNTKMRDVCPPDSSFYSYRSRCDAIMTMYSGATYDSVNDRLFVWGGWPTPTGYYGNEVYVFDLKIPGWIRLNDPSPYLIGGGGAVENPDGTPIQRHTYDGLEYLPDVDRFFVQGGAFGGYSDNNTWLFNPAAKTWQKVDRIPDSRFENITAYDPVTATVIERTTTHLYQFDPSKPSNSQWREVGRGADYATSGKTAALDTKRRKFVYIGRGNAYQFDLTNMGTGPLLNEQTLSTTGATEIVGKEGPGFVYDPDSDRFVAWSGGASVYSLNMDSGVWTKHTPATGTAPGSAQGAGTFGRFAYSRNYKLFIAVNSVDQDVYVYKLPSTGSVSPPHTPATPSAQIR